MAQSGAYKEDHIVLTFQQLIMITIQLANMVTQYDTLLAQSIVDQSYVWTKQIINPLTEERLQHPLQNDTTIMQIYNEQHHPTLITYNNRYYHYDGIRIAVPHRASHLHDNLRH